MKYYTEEEYVKELEHRRINKKMNRLETLSNWVSFGSIIWVVLYLSAWVVFVASFFV